MSEQITRHEIKEMIDESRDIILASVERGVY